MLSVNSLPSSIRSSTSAHTFCRLLKTRCFQQAYSSPKWLSQLPQIWPLADTVHCQYFIYLHTYLMLQDYINSVRLDWVFILQFTDVIGIMAMLCFQVYNFQGPCHIGRLYPLYLHIYHCLPVVGQAVQKPSDCVDLCEHGES